MHPEECLICKAPLEYLVRDEDMECAICHKKESSKTRCVNGHYVCNDCHTQGMDSIFGLCLSETSADPVAIVRRMMDLPFCHMHGPEHHVMVGAALLTAYKNAGGKLDLESGPPGDVQPGQSCSRRGLWLLGGLRGGDQCGAVPGHRHSDPRPWPGSPGDLSNQMTARALDSIGKVGGPRCCKRDSCLGRSWPPWTLPGSTWGWRCSGQRARLLLQCPKQPVHRKTLPLLGGKAKGSRGENSPEFLKGQKLRDILVFPENLLHRGPLGSSSTSLPRYRISRISRSHTRTPQTLSVMRARSGFMAGAR